MIAADDSRNQSSDATALDILTVRSRFLNKVLLYFVVVAPVTLVGSLLRALEHGWQGIYLLHIGMAVLVVAVAVLRHRLPYRVRACTLLGLFPVLAMAAFSSYGLLAGGHSLLIMFAVLAAVLLGTRAGLIASGIGVVIVAIMGVVVCSGTVTFPFDITEYATSPSAWNLIVVGFLMYIPVIVLAVGIVHDHLATSLHELRASHAKHERLVDNLVGAFLYRHDVEGVFSYVSSSITQVLGYAPKEFLTSTEQYLTDHPANELVKERTARSIQGIQQPAYEVQVRHRDGNPRWLEVSEVPVRDRSGTVVAVEGVAHDITERKAAEEALRLTQHTIDSCSTAIFWHRSDGKTQYVNDVACRQLGYSREELLNLSVSDIDLEWSSEYWSTGWQKVREAGVLTFESRHRRKDGHVFPVEITTNYIACGREEYTFTFATDITERKRAEDALRDSRTKLRAIFDHHYQLTGLLDREGRLLAANRTALEFAGVEETDVIGHYFWEGPWWDRSQEPDLRSFIERAARGEFVRFETTHRSADGEVRDFDFSLTPVRDDDGTVVYVVPEGRDITEKKQAEEALRESRDQLEQRVQKRTAQLEVRTRELEEANTRLQEVDRLKSMFIASMSHELRTPLNSIIGFTGIVLQGLSGDLTEKQRDQLTRSYGSAKHLLTLITDVIDISKIEAGRIDVFSSEFDLEEVVDEAVETIRPEAARKGLSLTVDLPAGVRLHLDRRRLLQCLLNYLSNAVKYSEEGTITLSARFMDGEVEIRVSDTGIGIAEEDLPRVFEAFERLESRLRVKAGGAGLGLYLTRKIATELLGGDVSVRSKLGRGSEFTLRVVRETG